MEMIHFSFSAALAEVQAPAVLPAGDPIRLVAGLVVPFGEQVSRSFGTAVFSAAGTRLPADLATVKLMLEHEPAPVGYAVASESTPAGLRMTFAVPTSHPRSVAYLEDLDANLRDGFSVGMALDESTQAAIMARMFGQDSGPVEMAGVVREVSAAAVPAFNSARADTFTSSTLATFAASPDERTSTVPTALEVPEPAAVLPTLDELAAQLAPMLASARPVHPLAQFQSYDEFAGARWAGEAERFALVNQTTADNPGVIQPAWLTEIVGILDAGRPAITALGGPRALPSTGMDIDWPYFDGDLTAIVARQTAEKSEVNSAKVSFKRGTAPLETYAGASDISYQLLRRSSPSYRDAYARILALAYAARTEMEFTADLETGATLLPSGVGYGNTAAALRRALFRASLRIRRATGRPADVVLVAEDVFELWGGLDGLYPSQYGTQNTSGTSDAGTLALSVSNLDIIPSPYLSAGVVLMTNSEAATWHEDGPFPVEQDDVAKLGKDVGIWGMGATRLSNAAGVLELTDAAIV